MIAQKVRGDFMYNPQITVTRIKEKGKSENVSVSKLNEQCGLNKNTISASATSKMGLSAKILFDIADCLGCSVDYLLGRTDKPEGIAQINTGDVGNNSSVNISKTACNCDDELVSLISSLSLLERSKVVLFIDSLRQNENKG